MNTARIVVLTVAVGAGGVATSSATGPDRKPLPGEFARSPITAGQPIRKSRLIKANGSGFTAAILPTGMRSRCENNPDRGDTADIVASEFIAPASARAASMWFTTASQTQPRYRSDQKDLTT